MTKDLRRNCWNIETLQEHAEEQAKFWRRRAVVPAIVAGAPLFITAIMPWFIEPGEKSIAWMMAKLSTLLILAAFLILLSRILWNYSNVWLGRAGMLEDLGLALKLIGKPRTGDTPLTEKDAQSLVQVAQSLERLRRIFEGDLLKGPSLEVPKVSTK
jgi:hypothetical protein